MIPRWQTRWNFARHYLLIRCDNASPAKLVAAFPPYSSLSHSFFWANHFFLVWNMGSWQHVVCKVCWMKYNKKSVQNLSISLNLHGYVLNLVLKALPCRYRICPCFNTPGSDICSWEKACKSAINWNRVCWKQGNIWNMPWGAGSKSPVRTLTSNMYMCATTLLWLYHARLDEYVHCFVYVCVCRVNRKSSLGTNNEEMISFEVCPLKIAGSLSTLLCSGLGSLAPRMLLWGFIPTCHHDQCIYVCVQSSVWVFSMCVGK